MLTLSAIQLLEHDERHHFRGPFAERTGNPVVDNELRRLNRRFRRGARAGFRVTTPSGRRRKKRIARVEGGRYLSLLGRVAMDIAERGTR
ncbi:hypothetical protein [Agromyces humi]|uniref:hypothetical protein n=1 Tax=Agromyces humi TaxID=1766800 RepID=UPI001357E48B|nr:hypothetical protein [Agromyces humi]